MNAFAAVPPLEAPRGDRPAAAPRVLQLRSSAGLYGADRVVLALNAALPVQGVPSRLLSIRNHRMVGQPLHDAAVAAGQDAGLLPCTGRFDLSTLRALRQELGSGAPRVVHVHDYKSAFYAWLVARNAPVALVSTLHGWVEESRALRAYTALELALLRRFDALVVVSAAQSARLLDAGIAAHKVWQVDNGIACPLAPLPPDASLRATLGLDRFTRVFGAVARLAPEKNLGMLLDAFAQAFGERADVGLVLAGDGPERDALQARAALLGIADRVRLLGERDDMARIYPLLDALVLPSLSEGMPLVVLEAMAHGLPVIASSVGDVPRLLGQSDAGKLVPAGDRAALADALRTLAGAPPRRDLSARRHVLQHHSEAAMAARYAAIYAAVQEARHADARS